MAYTAPSSRQAPTVQKAVEFADWTLPGAVTWGQQTKHFQMAFKRIVDLLVAGGVVLLLSPLLLAVALAIKLDSRGPVLYAQDRIGHNGRRFRMYKFRSMVVNAEQAKQGLISQNDTDAPLFKLKRDPRRTRVGGVIRRFSIDELPQLLNVLQGHMSLVGPRPALVEEAARYNGDHAQRVIAVPGMTGLWQVSGRSLLTFEQMVELDLTYARDWSLLMDGMILLKTLPVVLGGKGAY